METNKCAMGTDMVVFGLTDNKVLDRAEWQTRIHKANPK